MSQDSKLQKAVMAELEWEPSVVAAHVGVTARDGVVALTGHVDTYPQKHAAEMTVRQATGVVAVVGEIEMRLPVDTGWSDEAIATAAIDRISWDVTISYDAIPGDTIPVTVQRPRAARARRCRRGGLAAPSAIFVENDMRIA